MPVFKLILYRTYYRQGFFNVTMDFDRYVSTQERPITLILNGEENPIEGRITRKANPNGTARILGGVKLRDWFKANFRVKDLVEVDLSSPDAIRLKKDPH